AGKCATPGRSANRLLLPSTAGRQCHLRRGNLVHQGEAVAACIPWICVLVNPSLGPELALVLLGQIEQRPATWFVRPYLSPTTISSPGGYCPYGHRLALQFEPIPDGGNPTQGTTMEESDGDPVHNARDDRAGASPDPCARTASHASRDHAID